MRNLRQLVLTLLTCLASLSWQSDNPRKGEARQPLRAVGYYIAVRAFMYADTGVSVLGATNLPPGAIIGLHVYDSDWGIFNKEVRATVGDAGLFEADIHPKDGQLFRRGLVCAASFQPNFPPQPDPVVRIVGRHGEHLGDRTTNPQIEGNSRVTGLQAFTVLVE